MAARGLAFTWPDAAERAEHDLSSLDPTVRRAAAEKLETLGPGVAASLVLRALGDSDPEVRLSAAHAAIAKRIPEAAHLVLAWLGERDARLRKAACEVIGGLPDAEAVSQVARALGDSEAQVRAAAAAALGEQAPTLATPPLLGKLDDASPLVRVEVVRALARLGDPRAVLPLVGKAEDGAAEVRKEVARALGELGDPRAAPALVLELRDGLLDVKAAALASLGQLRAESAVDVISSFAADRSPLLRKAAIEALGRIGSAEAVRALVGLLGTGDDAAAGLERSEARAALVNAGAAAVAPLRAALAGAPSPATSTSAAWILGELRAKDAVSDIVRSMRRGTLPVTGALRCLSSLGSPEALPVVLEFVDDKSSATRREAIGAVEKLLDPVVPDGRAVEPLSAALRDPVISSSERARVASLLGRTGAPRVAPLLAAFLSTRDLELRLSAIDALGALGAEGFEGPLLDLIEDEDPSVRLHAAMALGRGGGMAARDALMRHLRQDSDNDRPATLVALGGLLSRVPSDAAILGLKAELDDSTGPARDALILAIGRADMPLALTILAKLSRSPSADDRRTVAAVLAARRVVAAAIELLEALLADPDVSVRSEAAWSLGEVGGLSSLSDLKLALQRSDPGPATNAAAAIARIVARARNLDVTTSELCPLLRDGRPPVRANVLAGLALVARRCGDGALERRLLESDVALVRLAAARAVRGCPLGAEDRRALARCGMRDPSEGVARQCARPGVLVPPGSEPVEFFIEDELGRAPRPGEPYLAVFADGMLRAGHADRRGAAFDAAAPRGEISLQRATSWTR
jgi:HEAT repeat protein